MQKLVDSNLFCCLNFFLSVLKTWSRYYHLQHQMLGPSFVPFLFLFCCSNCLWPYNDGKSHDSPLTSMLTFEMQAWHSLSLLLATKIHCSQLLNVLLESLTHFLIFFIQSDFDMSSKVLAQIFTNLKLLTLSLKSVEKTLL